MTVHILNGDALAGTFKASGIHGQVIVCRECLIDGPVSSIIDDTFWKRRSEFIGYEFGASPDEYNNQVRNEISRISLLTADDDVFLWFEYDLFCQANMWLIITMLAAAGVKRVYKVSPLARLNTKWQGFGKHYPDDLKKSLQNRVEFSVGDFQLGQALWIAYSEGDTTSLLSLGCSISPCYPRLDEVCQAEADRKKRARPRKTLQEILGKGYFEFSDIFVQFTQREGIYGFGDSQVRALLKDLGHEQIK